MYRRGAGKNDYNNKPVKKDVSDSDKYADLLVFGYACKLFRDDEKALYHEHGKHLIPWMGDKNIMIDRYDGRGHLHDLSEYDSGSWNTSYQLSEEEARIEALCDEERYLALHTDLLEEEARQEEEYKRLSEALADEGTYTAVAFKYSADYYDPSQPTEEEDAANKAAEEAEPEESEEPFVAPPGLDIPPDMELPATIKTHAIIERTANFVCQQGAQFEIVLKAKQANNSQFDFLRFDHYLNPYYKHILRAMKEGRYNLAATNKPEQPQESQSDDSDDDCDGNYLHPSLFAPKRENSRLEELMKPLQVMDPDHPLAELVRKAKQERNGTAAVEPKPEAVVEPTAPPVQYSADPVYYGYYMLPDGTFCLAPPPPGIDATSYYNSMPSAAVPPPTSSAGALSEMTTTSNLTQNVAMAPPAAAPVPVNSFSAPLASVPETSHSSKPEVQVSAPAMSAIIPPPPDIQPVIDKLAGYVARNGLKFEVSVRAKNDPRFDFLQPWHQYNTYYEFKKNYFMQKEGKSSAERAAGDNSDELQSDKSLQDSKLSKAAFAPISFAIKAKENDMLPLEKNRVRLDDDSDEDKLGMEEEGAVAMLVGPEMTGEKELVPVSAPEDKKPTFSLEELEAKQAKQKLEDRLAAAAREKLAQASKESKEKQLQAERKRKAALFLQTLRGPVSGEPEAKRAELDPASQYEMQEALSILSDQLPLHMSSVSPAYALDQRPPVEGYGAYRSRETPSSSYSTSRGSDRDRDKGRDKDKKKKKHKRRSRSRSRSKSKSRHSLPSAYKRGHRSRSRSYSPGRKSRRGPSSERRHDDREWERYHHSSSSSRPRGHSESRSPSDKKRAPFSTSGHVQAASSSPYSSPRGISPATSPASSLGHSRDGSQEKDMAVSSSIVSSVQSKITQDLMAKVRAMLATSKTFQPPTS